MTAADLAPARSGAASAWLAFRAILWRDVFVTGKEFWVLLIQEIGRASCRERVCQYV